MVNNGEGDTGLICATRHLTIFSAILQQLQCLNIQVPDFFSEVQR